MRELPGNIRAYQEGQSLPRLKSVVKIYIEGIEHDITSRVKEAPNLKHWLEYSENITYSAECWLVLDNADNFLHSPNGDGLLDASTTLSIEVKIWQYMDVPGGADAPVLNFGGWLDLNQLKPNYKSKDIEIPALDYYGKSADMSGARISTRYIGVHGLVLWTVGCWLKDAAIAGHELEVGVHTLATQIFWEPPAPQIRQCKLDEGEWTDLDIGGTVTVENENGEQVKIYIDDSGLLYFVADKETKIICKVQGEVHPYTNYFNPDVRSLINHVYNEMDISTVHYVPFEIKSSDDRKVLSFYDSVFNAAEFDYVNCTISDGARYVYIGYKSQVWRRDMEQDRTELIISGLASKVCKFEIDLSLGLLFIFTVGGTFIVNRIYKWALDGTGEPVQIFHNVAHIIGGFSVWSNAHFQIGFKYSAALQKFLWNYKETGFGSQHRGIASVDTAGVIENVLTDDTVHWDSFNVVWQSGGGGTTYYYFLADKTYDYTLCEVHNSGAGWSVVTEKIEWFDVLTYHSQFSIGIVNENENKVFCLAVIDDSFATWYIIYNFLTNEYIYPVGEQIYSPIYHSNKIYVVTMGGEGTKIGAIQNDVLTLDALNIEPWAVLRSSEPNAEVGWEGQMITFTRNYKDAEVMNLQTVNYNLMLRYSEWYYLCIAGEVDFTDLNLRSILTQLANTFLAYAAVKPDRSGWWISRTEYEPPAKIVLKKALIKERSRDTVYSEVYEKVVIRNQVTKASWGAASLEAKVLDIELPYAPTPFLKDLAKYYYEKHITARMRLRVKYAPTFFNYETLDEADLGELYPLREIAGLIQGITVNDRELELEVIY